MSEFLTPVSRKGVDDSTFNVWLVRVGADVAGFVSTNVEATTGYVMRDPAADTGRGTDGHESLGFAFMHASIESVAERVRTAWDPAVSSLRGAGVGGYPLVSIAGTVRLCCALCGHPSVSENEDDGRGYRFAYCHDCGRASRPA